MKEIDFAYTAGLIDGEGSILLSHSSNTKYRAPAVTITSTSYELLDYLKKTYGGYICSHKTYQAHHKPHWSWRIANNNAIDFLLKVYPFIKEKSKRRRTRLIINIYKSVTSPNGKYTTQQRINKLRFENIFLSS
jgi:intein/homing endonuclease